MRLLKTFNAGISHKVNVVSVHSEAMASVAHVSTKLEETCIIKGK